MISQKIITLIQTTSVFVVKDTKILIQCVYKFAVMELFSMHNAMTTTQLMEMDALLHVKLNLIFFVQNPDQVSPNAN